MTTEQMDWLDDERAGRHAPRVILNPDEPAPDLDPEQHFGHEKPDPMGGASLVHRLRAMGAVRTKQQSGESVEWVNAPLAVVVEQAKRAASVFSDDLHDWAEEHTHYTREARDQCAAGDHKYAELLDLAAEREKIAATIDTPQGVTTMAEEPIENRLRRAWLNGFRDGVDRASYAATESTGRWDY